MCELLLFLETASRPPLKIISYVCKILPQCSHDQLTLHLIKIDFTTNFFILGSKLTLNLNSTVDISKSLLCNSILC